MIYSTIVKEKDHSKFNSAQSVSGELFSLFYAIGSEPIADQFEIGRYCATHDFINLPEITVREGLDSYYFLTKRINKSKAGVKLEPIDAPHFLDTRTMATAAKFLTFFLRYYTPQRIITMPSNENDLNGLLAVWFLSPQ